MYRRPTENVYNISYGLNKKLYFKRGREEETDEGREAARERKRERECGGGEECVQKMPLSNTYT